MTQRPNPARAGAPLPIVQRFPAPGRRVEQAYRELETAQYGSPEDQQALGNPRLLARPWDPPTCVDPPLRTDLWEWLERVVVWLNHEYVWDVTGMIPPCWPRHPHLVHEIAVIADLRRTAGLALTGDGLEEWHRYALPAFTERMRQRMRAHCEEKDHQPWPAQGRHTRHAGPESAGEREATFNRDVDSVAPPAPPREPEGSPRLRLVDGEMVDLDTGEVNS